MVSVVLFVSMGVTFLVVNVLCRCVIGSSLLLMVGMMMLMFLCVQRLSRLVVKCGLLLCGSRKWWLVLMR